MARSGWLDPELSPQQLLDRQLITAEDMLSPLYGEADSAALLVTPGVGDATWTGFAPTIGTPQTIVPGLGAATWTGFAPALDTGPRVLPGTGAATWDGFSPTIGTPVTVLPAVGAATWTGFAPTISSGPTVLPGAGAATWTGFAPTIGTPVTVTPGLGAGTWTGLAPTVQTPRNVLPGSGAADWTGFAPTISVPSSVTVQPGVGAATWQGFAPSIEVVAKSTSSGRNRRIRAVARAQLVRGVLPVPILRLARLSVVNPRRVSLRSTVHFGLDLRDAQLRDRSVFIGTPVPQVSYRGTLGFEPIMRDARISALAPLELDEMLEILGIYELSANG